MIDERKKALRKELKSKRKELCYSCLKADMDKAVYKKLISCELVTKADCILCYISTEIEVDTIKFLEYCFDNDITVAVPKCTAEEMTFHIISSFGDTEKGMYDITEPKADCPLYDSLDFNSAVCIVPGLTFDDNGYRLGYGKGYYDKFLSKFNGKSIGLCYKSYMNYEIPKDKYDLSTDIVITD